MEELRYIREYKNKWLGHWFDDIESLDHMVKVDRDWFQQELSSNKLRSLEYWDEKCKNKIHTLIRRTLNKCIATHAWRTRTHWDVIEYITNCVLTTRTRTWIDTFAIDARLVMGTIVVHYTLWSTNHIRITYMFLWTLANSIQTFCIWTTGWWVTWIIMWRFFR